MHKKKKLYMALGIAGIILLAVLIYIGTAILPKLQIGKEISDLLQPVLTEENQSMHLDIAADFAGEQMTMDSNIYKVKQDEVSYLVLEQMDFPVYIVDNILLLENGHAFKIAETVEKPKRSYDDLFVQIAAAYEVFDITCVKNDSESKYSINVIGEQVQELLAMAMPTDKAPVDSIEKLQITMTAHNSRLDRIEMTGKAEVNGNAVQVEVIISDFRELEPGKYEIPKVVKDAVKTVDRDSLFNLTEDLYRLLAAFEQFQNEENKNGTVTLHANCGIINFENTFELESFVNNGNGSMDTEEIENLPAMIGVLCMEGEIRCTENAEAFVYTLSLDETSMEKITGMVVPELVNYVMHLTDGVAKVVVEGNHITSIEIAIKGNINILITKFPMEVGIEFQYE